MHHDDMAHELRRCKTALKRIADSSAFGPATSETCPELQARMDFAQKVLDGEPLIGLSSRCYRKFDPIPDIIRKSEEGEDGVRRWREICDALDENDIERDKARYAGVDP